MSVPDPVLRALAHPVRLRMLSLMWAHPYSATDLAAALDVGHGLATQHVRRLLEAGLIELVEVRPGRGSGSRLFRTVRGHPLSERGETDAALLGEALAVNLRHRALRRGPGDGVVADADLCVPHEAWEGFRMAVLELVDRLHEEALAPDDPAGMLVGVTVMAFPVQDLSGSRPANERKVAVRLSREHGQV